MNRNAVKSNVPRTLPVAPLRLLVVEDDDVEARMMVRAMRQDVRVADLCRANTLAEARRLLRENPFEAALVNHELPDGDSFDLLDFMGVAAIHLPVVVLTAYGHEDVAIATMKAGASDCVRKELDYRHLDLLPRKLQEAVYRFRRMQQREESARAQAQAKLLETLRATVLTVKHEINNPLAIISGNAQLLTELAHFMELDEELVKPIRDIEEASLRIAGSLDKLSNLKEAITREYVKREESLIDLHHNHRQP